MFLVSECARIALQAVTLAFAVLGLVIWGSWIRAHPDRRGYAIPPITWLAHSVFFYTAVLAVYLQIVPDYFDFRLWSAALRLHGTFLIFGLGLIMLVDRVHIR